MKRFLPAFFCLGFSCGIAFLTAASCDAFDSVTGSTSASVQPNGDADYSDLFDQSFFLNSSATAGGATSTASAIVTTGNHNVTGGITISMQANGGHSYATAGGR